MPPPRPRAQQPPPLPPSKYPAANKRPDSARPAASARFSRMSQMETGTTAVSEDDVSGVNAWVHSECAGMQTKSITLHVYSENMQYIFKYHTLRGPVPIREFIGNRMWPV